MFDIKCIKNILAATIQSRCFDLLKKLVNTAQRTTKPYVIATKIFSKRSPVWRLIDTVWFWIAPNNDWLSPWLIMTMMRKKSVATRSRLAAAPDIDFGRGDVLLFHSGQCRRDARLSTAADASYDAPGLTPIFLDLTQLTQNSIQRFT